MNAPTIERPAPAANPPEPTHGHRRVKVVSVAVAIGIVAAITFLANYQPLVPGCCRGHTETTYRQGASFSYGISLRNDSHLPIKITGVDADGGYALLRTTGIYVRRDIATGAEGNTSRGFYEPFRPFTLGPGQERGLLVSNVFDECSRFAPGTGNIYGALQVSFSILGLPRHTWVGLGNMLTIRSPKACPGRA